jgi:alkaline phosphatase
MRALWIFALLAIAAVSVFSEEDSVSDRIVLYPVDRAVILAGAKFDVKVEFPEMINEKSAKATVNGVDVSEFFKQKATFVDAEEYTIRLDHAPATPPAVTIPLRPINARLGSSLILRGCSIDTPGKYKLEATDGTMNASVEWEVYATPAKRVAKNVILMIGDGMSLGHRVAARVLSKGIKEGKYNGKLAMDSLAHMALLSTSGVDSIVTDSANSAHAYTTGHKSSDEALGVYADRTRNPFDDPQVENITSLAQRINHMSVGIVTTTEVQDATPASMVAHTRRRGKFPEITQMLYAAHPDVLMGGGSRLFTSKLPGEKNGVPYLDKFKADGYTVVRDRTELLAAGTPQKLLGLFNEGNMDGILDRKYLKPKYVSKFPDQPDLPEMAQSALNVLSKNENGFVLMIESGLIDKFTHNMDWERAVMDTIMYDKTVAVVREFMQKNPETLLLVTADHCHGISICGTIDDNRPQAQIMRDRVGTGAEAGYPNYVDADGDGYPDSVNVSKRLAVFFTAFPDYYETFAPKLDGVFMPTMRNPDRPLLNIANDKYKNVPNAMLRTGNVSRYVAGGVHAMDDVILTADGPGSESVHGAMDNTEVFRLIVNALALSPAKP